MKDLAELRPIAEAALPGPYEQVGNTIYFPHPDGQTHFQERVDYFVLLGLMDTAKFFVTFYPQAVLELIDALEKANKSMKSYMIGTSPCDHCGNPPWQATSKEKLDRYLETGMVLAALRAENANLQRELTALRASLKRETS